jgi:electron transfer flavoprotein alpha subunit
MALSLVIAEHDNASIKGTTLNTVSASRACGGEVHVLVAGSDAAAAAGLARHGSLGVGCDARDQSSSH